MQTLPAGYSIVAPWPPNSGNVKLTLKGETIREFPYRTTDATIISIARLHKRFGVFSQ